MPSLLTIVRAAWRRKSTAEGVRKSANQVADANCSAADSHSDIVSTLTVTNVTASEDISVSVRVTDADRGLAPGKVLRFASRRIASLRLPRPAFWLQGAHHNCGGGSSNSRSSSSSSSSKKINQQKPDLTDQRPRSRSADAATRPYKSVASPLQQQQTGRSECHSSSASSSSHSHSNSRRRQPKTSRASLSSRLRGILCWARGGGDGRLSRTGAAAAGAKTDCAEDKSCSDSKRSAGKIECLYSAPPQQQRQTEPQEIHVGTETAFHSSSPSSVRSAVAEAALGDHSLAAEPAKKIWEGHSLCRQSMKLETESELEPEVKPEVKPAVEPLALLPGDADQCVKVSAPDSEVKRSEESHRQSTIRTAVEQELEVDAGLEEEPRPIVRPDQELELNVFISEVESPGELQPKLLPEAVLPEVLPQPEVCFYSGDNAFAPERNPAAGRLQPVIVPLRFSAANMGGKESWQMFEHSDDELTLADESDYRRLFNRRAKTLIGCSADEPKDWHQGEAKGSERCPMPNGAEAKPLATTACADACSRSSHLEAAEQSPGSASCLIATLTRQQSSARLFASLDEPEDCATG